MWSICDAVGRHLFTAHDWTAVGPLLRASRRASDSLSSWLCAMAQFAAPRHALVVATREADGHFSSVRMARTDAEPVAVPRLSFSRCVLFDSVAVLVVERSCVRALVCGRERVFDVRADLDALPSSLSAECAALRAECAALRGATVHNA